MRIPFTNYHILITKIGDVEYEAKRNKYFLTALTKHSIATYMLEGNKIPAIKTLRAYGKEYGHEWGFKEAKDYVEANFKFVHWKDQPEYVKLSGPKIPEGHDHTGEVNEEYDSSLEDDEYGVEHNKG